MALTSSCNATRLAPVYSPSRVDGAAIPVELRLRGGT
jgi:hypothetical protein